MGVGIVARVMAAIDDPAPTRSATLVFNRRKSHGD
jgi:hypothetical protein